MALAILQLRFLPTMDSAIWRATRKLLKGEERSVPFFEK